MTGPATLASHTVPTITAAAEAAGRPAPEVVAALPICVTDDAGRRARRARAQDSRCTASCRRTGRCSTARAPRLQATSRSSATKPPSRRSCGELARRRRHGVRRRGLRDTRQNASARGRSCRPRSESDGVLQLDEDLAVVLASGIDRGLDAAAFDEDRVADGHVELELVGVRPLRCRLRVRRVCDHPRGTRAGSRARGGARRNAPRARAASPRRGRARSRRARGCRPGRALFAHGPAS